MWMVSPYAGSWQASYHDAPLHSFLDAQFHLVTSLITHFEAISSGSVFL
jgi:hypothetical protein